MFARANPLRCLLYLGLVAEYLSAAAVAEQLPDKPQLCRQIAAAGARSVARMEREAVSWKTSIGSVESKDRFEVRILDAAQGRRLAVDANIRDVSTNLVDVVE